MYMYMYKSLTVKDKSGDKKKLNVAWDCPKIAQYFGSALQKN